MRARLQRWTLLRRLGNIARDPALYVTGFSFYAGMHRWLSWQQLALCYGGTVLVIVIHSLWTSRRAQVRDFTGDVGSGLLWGSAIFAIGFVWGTTCGYILDWMPGPRLS